ncbi:MAG: ECF RNA polymerase sigma factor SigW [Fimbriimonadales bacterium]|nr:ECF RNA polymerase sigma factor SigW [Fimbriimonadales bacterium]
MYGAAQVELSTGAIRLTQRTHEDALLDGALIDRCRNRDAEAFGLLVDRYQTRVFGYVRRMVGSAEDAEDIAQEVFVRAFQNIGRFDGRASLTTWLFKIASNLCIDRSRRKGRRPEEAPLASVEDPESGAKASDPRWDPETHLVALEMEDAVEGAISQLSDKLRSVLLLHDIEEMSYDEIASALKIPVGTVKSRLFLARGHLQEALRGFIEAGA